MRAKNLGGLLGMVVGLQSETDVVDGVSGL